MYILNLAAGKFNPLDMSRQTPAYVLNVDTSYYTKTTPEAIETSMLTWGQNPDRCTTIRHLNKDVFEFMERIAWRFDRVALYRFLEHIPFTQVEYFIYLVSTVTNPGAEIDIIVPDYKILAEMILIEDGIFEGDSAINLMAHNIKLTTELLNEPSCPHASIWTQKRMKYFWELEGRFKVKSQRSGFLFDGRDIYLRSIVERV